MGGMGGVDCGWKVVVGGVLVDTEAWWLLGAEWKVVGNLNPSSCRDGHKLNLLPCSQISERWSTEVLT